MAKTTTSAAVSSPPPNTSAPAPRARVAEEAIQLHGGIGMTWEYNLAHHAKRLVMIAHQFGDDDHHLKAYAKLMQVA